MTSHILRYGLTDEQADFLDALRAVCTPSASSGRGLPIAALADWEPKARAVGLRLWLRDVAGYLVLAWEQVEAGQPEVGAGGEEPT